MGNQNCAVLEWQAFPAGEHGFFRSPVLLSDAQEAVLIDGGFTFSDGKAVVNAIHESAKKLSTVYVTQSDPDYYFSLAPLKASFPEANFIAAPAVVSAIQASVQKKLDVWGPQLKDNGPQHLNDVVIPIASEINSLSLSGWPVEIINATGLANRRYVWVPSLDAIFGGLLVFSGLHVWTADTPSAEQRMGWIKALDEITARRPKVVVPGHTAIGAPTDASALAYTRDYLLAFDAEVAKARDSVTLIAAMKRHYPDAGLGTALEIGAKVALGEMKWG